MPTTQTSPPLTTRAAVIGNHPAGSLLNHNLRTQMKARLFEADRPKFVLNILKNQGYEIGTKAHQEAYGRTMSHYLEIWPMSPLEAPLEPATNHAQILDSLKKWDYEEGTKEYKEAYDGIWLAYLGMGPVFVPGREASSSVMDTETLSGKALAWAVAKLQFESSTCQFKTAIDWELAKPIVEREGIELHQVRTDPDVAWRAALCDSETGIKLFRMYGPTPTVAALRCYVFMKLGSEVKIPDQLLEVDEAQQPVERQRG